VTFGHDGSFRMKKILAKRFPNSLKKPDWTFQALLKGRFSSFPGVGILSGLEGKSRRDAHDETAGEGPQRGVSLFS